MKIIFFHDNSELQVDNSGSSIAGQFTKPVIVSVVELETANRGAAARRGTRTAG